jgi:hypothetical protein
MEVSLTMTFNLFGSLQLGALAVKVLNQLNFGRPVTLACLFNRENAVYQLCHTGCNRL